jgi:DNA phosphorothioation-dependent restriction protein DptG
MRYKINFEEIKSNYIKKDSLQHNAGSKITILPYTTQFKESNRPEIVNFIETVGEFSRRITGTKEPREFSFEKYQNDIISKVDMDKKNISVFIDLIKELFFDENGLVISHPKTINYINSTPFNKKLGKFLFDVLYIENEEVRSLINITYHKDPDNILLRLMVNNLPKQESKEFSKVEYKNMIPYIGAIFMEDLKYLLKGNSFTTDNLEKLLKFYYMFYTVQLSMTLNKTFNAEMEKPTEIYFAFDWENTGKGRLSVEHGWEIVESNVLKLFSHANTLDLINHSHENMQYSYIELKHRLDNLTFESKNAFVEELHKLIEFYQGYIKDVNWEHFKYTSASANDCYNAINKLFKAINYQFSISGRKERQRDYGTWFVEFCKENFLRRRGRYGYVFNLTEDLTIFITKICIKGYEKIKLKDLFGEFKKRGICLDNESKTKLIQLYEKLNILEKKSDSGDAQYVKAIL